MNKYLLTTLSTLSLNPTIVNIHGDVSRRVDNIRAVTLRRQTANQDKIVGLSKTSLALVGGMFGCAVNDCNNEIEFSKSNFSASFIVAANKLKSSKKICVGSNVYNDNIQNHN